MAAVTAFSCSNTGSNVAEFRGVVLVVTEEVDLALRRRLAASLLPLCNILA